MRKLNVDHEEESISQAFAGTDKLQRLESQLVEIIKSPGRMSEQIAIAVEKYADTIEEAIGISLMLYRIIKNYKKLEEESTPSVGNMLKSTGLLESALSVFDGKKPPSFSEFMTAIGAPKNLIDKAKREEITDDFPMDSLRNYMNSVDCSTCDADGKCPIQDMAKRKRLI